MKSKLLRRVRCHVEARERAAATIARHMARIWEIFRRGEFTDYLTSVFNIPFNSSPKFEGLYIAEVLEGNIEKASISGIIKRWWLVDDHGMVDVPRATLPSDDELAFFRRPFVRFFTDGEGIVMMETYGVGVVFQKTARLAVSGEKMEVTDEKVVWKSSPEIGTAFSARQQN
jgi:hypothetical protein